MNPNVKKKKTWRWKTNGVSKTDFQEAIYYLLEKRQWTQARLAKSSGVSAITINRILRGHNKPRVDTCHALAKALDISPSHLLELL